MLRTDGEKKSDIIIVPQMPPFRDTPLMEDRKMCFSIKKKKNFKTINRRIGTYKLSLTNHYFDAFIQEFFFFSPPLTALYLAKEAFVFISLFFSIWPQYAVVSILTHPVHYS